jgi:hypothetical protein
MLWLIIRVKLTVATGSMSSKRAVSGQVLKDQRLRETSVASRLRVCYDGYGDS